MLSVKSYITALEELLEQELHNATLLQDTMTFIGDLQPFELIVMNMTWSTPARFMSS